VLREIVHDPSLSATGDVTSVIPLLPIGQPAHIDMLILMFLAGDLANRREPLAWCLRVKGPPADTSVRTLILPVLRSPFHQVPLPKCIGAARNSIQVRWSALPVCRVHDTGVR
jgi:hypothetical protein